MKAVFQSRYGSPDRLEVREVERPAVGENQVLVKVRAASLHPDVWHVVRGRPYILRFMGSGFRKPGNPIPGTDMAGVVEAVAPAVDAFRAGDAVFGDTTATHPWINGGAFAEYVAVDPGLLALKPDAVSFEQAAAVPTSGLITLQNLRGVDRWPPGRKVLINGAGGGVGSLALQIVKAYGAHVTAVDSAAKLEVLRDLGADRVMDYTQEDFARGGERYDLIFDVPGTRPFSSMKPALKPGGRYVPIGHEGFGAAGSTVFGLIPHFLAIMARSRFEKGLRGPDVPVPGKPEAIGALRAFLENGTIKPVIDSAFGLDEVRAAFRRMIGGETTGRVILVP